MKKLTALCLVLMLVLSCAACSSGPKVDVPTYELDSSLGLSDSVLDGQLAIEGVVYQMPIQVSQLEADGWICSQAGKGSFVGDVPIPLSAEQHHLWAELDKLLAAAAHLDISREEIIRHIREGGNEHA